MQNLFPSGSGGSHGGMCRAPARTGLRHTGTGVLSPPESHALCRAVCPDALRPAAVLPSAGSAAGGPSRGRGAAAAVAGPVQRRCRAADRLGGTTGLRSRAARRSRAAGLCRPLRSAAARAAGLRERPAADAGARCDDGRPAHLHNVHRHHRAADVCPCLSAVPGLCRGVSLRDFRGAAILRAGLSRSLLVLPPRALE